MRHSDYRDVRETGFDAVSSIGLTEHIGVRNYPAYFGFLKSKLRTGGLLLNHCITRQDNKQTSFAGGFTDRYVFPDGELTGSGRIISEVQDVGFEVLHEENFRHHYAMTLRDWCRNLVEHWDEAVAEVGLPIAKVWGLYMAASRVGFEQNNLQLHHVLAAKVDVTGRRRPAAAALVDGLAAVDAAGAELVLQQLQRDLFGVAPRRRRVVAARFGEHASLLRRAEPNPRRSGDGSSTAAAGLLRACVRLSAGAAARRPHSAPAS